MARKDRGFFMSGGYGGRGGGGPGRSRFYRQTDEHPHITKNLIWRVVGCYKPYKGLLAVIAFFVIVYSALGLVSPILIKDIIDDALPQKNLHLLVFFIAAAFIVTIILNLANVFQNYLNTLVSKRITRDMRSQMFERMEAMSLKFFSNLPVGDVSARMSYDIGGVDSVLSSVFIQILQNVFIFVLTAVTLFLTNWILALVSLAILPLFIFPTKRVGKIRWGIATELQQKYAKMNSVIQENLNVSGILLLKLFTKEKDKKAEFDAVSEEVTKLNIRENVVGRWFFMVVQSFTSIGPLLIYLIGGIIMIETGAITVGIMVMFVSLLSRLYSPIASISNIHVDIVRSMALFERIFQYLDMPEDVSDAPGAKEMPPVDGDIVFENVVFKYDEKNTALNGINIHIKAGQTVALVGPSGAGKTTITSLVPRLYDVTAGKVMIDGMDVRSVTQNSLRRNIGMVTQDTFLFNATIRENLLFARGDATQEEIEQACRTANIHDFIISLANGYDTIVGERGVKLSGGEKQRISIARCLLKNPRIVIFDEATSSLDSGSEAAIQDAIEPLMRNRTGLIIAHRLSTIMSSDWIYVVDSGKIAEQGTHEQLLAAGGIYRELYNIQFRKSETKAGEYEER